MSTDTTQSSRRFYWVWFGVFTTVSVVANAWHAGVKAPAYFAALSEGDTAVLWAAWKGAGDLPPAWFTLGAVALGALMPIALAFGSHALANPRPNIGRGRAAVNYALTGATVLGAFVLSFLAMQDLSMMLLGLGPWTAAIVPIAVDIAIVSALAELVARSPQVQDDAVERRVADHAADLNAARQADMERFMGQVDAARGADMERLMGHVTGRLDAAHDALMGHVTGQLGAAHDALVERFTGQLDATRDALTERFMGQTASRPTPRDAAAAPRSIARPDPFTLTREASEVAADLAASGSFTQPAEVLARVLGLALDGMSQRKIADAVTSELPKSDAISSSTIGRIVAAARDLEAAPAPELEAAS